MLGEEGQRRAGGVGSWRVAASSCVVLRATRLPGRSGAEATASSLNTTEVRVEACVLDTVQKRRMGLEGGWSERAESSRAEGPKPPDKSPDMNPDRNPDTPIRRLRQKWSTFAAVQSSSKHAATKSSTPSLALTRRYHREDGSTLTPHHFGPASDMSPPSSSAQPSSTTTAASTQGWGVYYITWGTTHASFRLPELRTSTHCSFSCGRPCAAD